MNLSGIRVMIKRNGEIFGKMISGFMWGNITGFGAEIVVVIYIIGGSIWTFFRLFLFLEDLHFSYTE